MSTSSRTCAIIPVFNHAASVAEVARGAAARVEFVFVVDDGSTDGSGDAAQLVAREAPGRVEVVRLLRNEGKGAALVAGLRRAAECGFTHAVTLDADGQHRPSDIPAFVAAANAAPRAVVVGVRKFASDRVPRASHVGRWVSNFWTLRTTGYDLPDTQCGFRVYPVGDVLALPRRCLHYDFEVEVLVRAAWAGLALLPVPIDVWYPPRGERISHFRVLSDNVRISWTYTRLAFRRLLPTRAARRTTAAAARPRVGLRDAWRWLHEASVAGTRPTELGVAVAVGAFIGSTPLWGLHGLLSVYVGARLHLNLVATFLGSNVSMPFVAPYLVFSSVQCGHWMTHGEFVDVDPRTLTVGAAPGLLLEYVLGSFVVGAVLAATLGLLTLCAAALVRRRAL